jgi:hypothetical protein
MSLPQLQRSRTFTVGEANSMLPLIRAIVADLVPLARYVMDRRERLSLLSGGRSRDPSDLYQEELAQIEEELADDTRRLTEYLEELRQLGVEPKSATDGLVDFPSIVQGRPVYLCWKLGEPEVRYWHDLEAGYAGRRPLPAESGPCGNCLTPGAPEAN